MPRSTADIVVIILAVMVCSVIFLIVAGILIIKLFHPTSTHELATEAIINIVTTVIGALVGFIGGRVYENKKLNGGL
jgi:DMSO reductase anchor subunit